MAKTLKKHWGTNRYIAIKKNNWEHIVKMANEHLKEVEGTTLVVCGDTPLITHTLQKLIEHHESTHAQATVLSQLLRFRLVMGELFAMNNVDYNVLSKKRRVRSTKALTEISSGIFAFDNRVLFSKLEEVKMIMLKVNTTCQM